ncbi:T9SS-dependent choice-of-anchor J family protein [Flavobacterium phycosphaerae]|uniref:T9SS-dependent choice-of-anchor J family protein n=1 Tax=Flavobacterium phycosphaerae TaxID=2697515 RepID=UPI00138A0735|nr:choice-of-anchor J domain-containing protein [Flavobacterium phycosphaerae]
MKKTLLLFVLILFVLPFFSTYAQGLTCADPIQITTLPYTTTDDTANYSDSTDVSQPSICANTTANYMTGNDVFYAYTPTTDGVISINMTPSASWSGIFVYDGCSNVGVACLAGVANSTSGLRTINNLTVQSGHQYIIVISTFASPQTIGYTLEIQPLSCLTPIEVTYGDIFTNSVNLSWYEMGTATSWEVLVLPTTSPAPTADSSGVIVATNSYTTTNNLTPSTSYIAYVRSLCSSTDKSSWGISPAFTTPCLPFSVPFQEGFNSTSATESCWRVWNFNGDVDLWNMNYTTAPFEGNQCAILLTDYNNGNNNDWLVSPTITLTGNQVLKYQYKVQSSAEPNNFRVMLSTNGPNLSGFTTTLVPLTTYSNATYNEQVVSLAGYSGPVNIAWNVPPSSIDGWRIFIDNVIIEDIPTCPAPTNITSTAVTQTSVTLGWTELGTATSWEVFVVPSNSTAPLATDSGQVVTTNPAVISGLNPQTTYSCYVRSICSASDLSNWSLKIDFTTTLSNDDCINAVVAPVNNLFTCTQVVSGALTGATSSGPNLATPCIGVADDDVWFKFVASNTEIRASLHDIVGTTTNLNMAVYAGQCGALTQYACSMSNTLSISLYNLTIGNTYYLRVYSNASTPQNVTFNLCVATIPNCSSAIPLCGLTNYQNMTGVSSIGAKGCLTTTPNPSFFSLRVGSTGPIHLLLTQSSFSSSTTGNLDVDYAAWGPFPSQSVACDAISSGQDPGIGVPVTQQTGCSFSPNSVENLNIENAVVGQYYIILITNYSDDHGYITVSQSNSNQPGAGAIDCSSIKLNAFLDNNANGAKDVGEPDFGLGQFHYEKNNDGNSHSVISPSGIHTIYDYNSANNYNLSYTINADYTSLYNVTANYTNINITNSGLPFNYFPVTLIQNYNDLGITIVPMSNPRAGSTYKNKIVYTNNGTQSIASGNLTFTVDPVTTISSISQSGTTAISNGFSYAFTNLLPFESRSIIVTITVPPIPTVALGQLITNTASIVPPVDDVVANNNTSNSTQAVIGAYDPNDKIESHGEQILFSSFTANDYLEYTIRFENNGNAMALNVAVHDVLDSQLDANTLVMLDASANYILDRLGNTLIWNFQNIMLPVAIANTDTGKGYIKFKIKPKPGFTVGDIIPNTASIYFDTNPAIITNTFNTKFVQSLSNPTFSNNTIVLYPNPAKTSVHIQSDTTQLESIHLYDISGKIVKQVDGITNTQYTVDVSALAKGIYFVEIVTENKLKQIKKLIIQ